MFFFPFLFFHSQFVVYFPFYIVQTHSNFFIPSFFLSNFLLTLSKYFSSLSSPSFFFTSYFFLPLKVFVPFGSILFSLSNCSFSFLQSFLGVSQSPLFESSVHVTVPHNTEGKGEEESGIHGHPLTESCFAPRAAPKSVLVPQKLLWYIVFFSNFERNTTRNVSQNFYTRGAVPGRCIDNSIYLFIYNCIFVDVSTNTKEKKGV